MSIEEKIKLEQVTMPSANSAQFLNPQRIISHIDIHQGMKVAHFGCGTGYFTFPIAARVGSEGVVWALDILEHKINLIRGNAKALGLKNIEVKRVNLEKPNGSGLGDDSVDWVVMVNMLYQNEKKSRIIGEAKRILKSTGSILIIDWKDSDGSIGPEVKSRITREGLIKGIRKNGLGIVKELDISKSFFGVILTK